MQSSQPPSTDRVEMLSAPISDIRFCAVDVETSGLNMASRLVEIGAVKFDLSGECYEFQSLVNPCESIWPGATEIHGITDDMVRNAPRAAGVLPGLLNFMRGCVFLAHNATFDVKMIANELARLRMDAPDNPVVCTIRLARKRRATSFSPGWRGFTTHHSRACQGSWDGSPAWHHPLSGTSR
jgi:DNA polymerase-3 subunit epsilon